MNVNTYEFVKSEFEKKNYILLENEYKNAHTKMKYKCKNGHICNITYNKFQQGRGCKKCADMNTSSKKRLDYNFVKEVFEKKEWKLLETEYINCDTKMKCICNFGHECYITYYKFNNNQGCRQCYLKNNSGKNNNFWNPDREQVKMNKKMRMLCNKLLYRCLKTLNLYKNNRSHKLLGYKPIDLKNHLQLHSKWDILKDQNWHLDHILPIKSFIEYGINDLKIINNLNNLQPLDSKVNILKGCKYHKKSFHKYMEQFPEWKYNKENKKYIKK